MKVCLAILADVGEGVLTREWQSAERAGAK